MTPDDLVEPHEGLEVPRKWWDAVGSGLTYDREAADKAVRFFPRYMRHFEAEWGGRPFVLAPWQERRIVRPIFGLMRGDGLRAIRRAFVEVPRKNGKSLLASGIALKLLFADREPGARVISAALDKEQASQVYAAAELAVEASEVLTARSRIFKGNNKRIVTDRNATYRVVSQDGRRQHGGNLHGIIGDEIHVWPGAFQGSLLEALLTSTGSRRQPLAFLITTAGYDRESICFHEYSRACNVRDGVLPRADYLPVIYEASLEDDWHDPDLWRRVNPGLGISKKMDYMETQHREALETAAARNTFLRLDLDIWTDQATAWIPAEAWEACAEPELEFPDRGVVSVGLDLSTSEDTTAVVLAWQLPDGRVGLWPRAFIPEATVAAREVGEAVPYRDWARAGYCEITPGNVIDYEAVLAYIREIGTRCTITRIAYDPWQAEFFRQHLEREGFETVAFRQGFRSMAEPCAMFQRLWKGQDAEGRAGRRLVHSGDPLFAYQARSAAVLTDPTGSIKPAKQKSKSRIDEIVAAIMAAWLLLGGDPALKAENVVA